MIKYVKKYECATLRSSTKDNEIGFADYVTFPRVEVLSGYIINHIWVFTFAFEI